MADPPRARNQAFPGSAFLGAMAVMAMAGLIGFVWTAVAGLGAGQVAEQATAAASRVHRNDETCRALVANVRSAAAGEAAADIASLQLWLNLT